MSLMPMFQVNGWGVVPPVLPVVGAIARLTTLGFVQTHFPMKAEKFFAMNEVQCP